MTTTTIKTNVSINNKGELKFKTGKFVVPKNVLDINAFHFALQYFVNIFVEDDLLKSYNSGLDSETISDGELENRETKYKAWKDYIEKDFCKELCEFYGYETSEVNELVESLSTNTFAKVYAISICKKTKMNDVDIRFTDSSISQETVLRDYIRCFSPEYESSLTPDYSKKAINGIIQFCNDNFSTDLTGDKNSVYKKLDYTKKITVGSIRQLLIPRCKRDLEHDYDGHGLKDKFKSDNVMMLQLINLCLHYAGVPIWDGTTTKTHSYIKGGGKTTCNAPTTKHKVSEKSNK